MNELHLFAGAGGGILGGMLLGHTTVCAVEIEAYPRSILLQRQRDGILPKFPIWDDIKTFDGRPWKGIVDVVCGGFPCQDISSAGSGKGIRSGTRSSLWAEQARIIGEVQPSFVFVENSPMLVERGLDVVLGDLSCLGYDARWGVFGGSISEALHERNRIWILAYANKIRFNRSKKKSHFVAKKRDSSKLCIVGRLCGRDYQLDREIFESEIFGTFDAVAGWVDELRAIGNGQIPTVAALAWTILFEGLSNAEKPTG